MSKDDKHKQPELTPEAQKAVQPAQGGALSAVELSPSKQPAAAEKPDLSLETWQKSKLAWRDTPQGRLGIRMISRGLFGAAAFSWGGWYAAPATGMKGYQFFPVAEKNTPYLKFIKENVKYPLQIIARTVDEFAGRPIKWAVHTVTQSQDLAERTVRFRPMSYKFSGRFNEKGGRSLGEEAIGITFDFFSASVGDAFGRDLVDVFDKNVKKTWLDEHGHVKIDEAAKAAVKSAWRYVSYNGGEDWAVAIPYAYFMKTQRYLLNKVSPGFKFDANEGLNGSAFKVNNKAQIIGNYNAVGAFDLQSRFTTYNIGTLMYREAYDWVGNMLKGTPTNLYGAPDAKHEHRTIGETIGDLAKWTARSAVKGVMVMTPAVPFFWITRTPQTKYKGTFINPVDQSMLTYSLGNEHDSSLQQYGVIKGLLGARNAAGAVKFTEDTPVGFRKFTGVSAPGSANGWVPIGSPSPDLNPLKHNVDLHSSRYATGAVASVMRPFGEANNAIRTKFRKSLLPYVQPTDMSRFINASISYTPYMYAKAETSRLWDTGKMDLAAERMIDGASSFNMGEFKAGLKEVWRAVQQKPFEDPLREAEALRRLHIDTSAADSDNMSSAEEYKEQQREEAKRKAASQKVPTEAIEHIVTHNPAEAPLSFTTDSSETLMGAAAPATHFVAPQQTATYGDQLSWQERMIQGRKPSETRDPSDAVKSRPVISHAERQKMQEILAAAVPPTNSKH